MALTVPLISGQYIFLQYLVGLKTPGSPVLHLYSNDPPIQNTTILSNLVECTSTGYAPITLTSSSWTTVQNSGITTAVYSQVTFNFNSSGVANGYWLGDSSGNLLLAERFSNAPYTIPSTGEIQISSRITLS